MSTHARSSARPGRPCWAVTALVVLALAVSACGPRGAYLNRRSVPNGTEKRVYLVHPDDPGSDLRLFTGAQFYAHRTDEQRRSGPYALSGYHPASDSLVVGDRTGVMSQLPLTHLQSIALTPSHVTTRGMEDGSIYGSVLVGIIAAGLAGAGGAESGQASAVFFSGALLGAAAGAVIGAVVGSGGAYEESYDLGDGGWQVAFDPGHAVGARGSTARRPAPAAPRPAPVVRAAPSPPADPCAQAALAGTPRPLGCPCQSADQCQATHCLPLGGGPVCTSICEGQCEAGFQCKPAPALGGAGLCVRATTAPAAPVGGTSP